MVTPTDYTTYWKESFKLNTYLVDPLRRLNLFSFFHLFQEAAQQHAQHLGFGYEEMKAEGQVWALLRVLLEIDEMPEWNQEVVLTTWPRDMKGIFATRDFKLDNPHGKSIIRGTSLWTVISEETRKPIRHNRLIERHDGFSETRRALERKTTKINWPEGLKKVASHKVAYSHLDMNGHVNNVRYLEWILNEFPYNTVIEKQPVDVEINFIAEARLGDILDVRLPEEQPKNGVYEGFIVNSVSQQQVYAVRIQLD